MDKKIGAPHTLFVWGGLVFGMRSRRIELAVAGFEPTSAHAEVLKDGKIIEHGEGESRCRKKK